MSLVRSIVRSGLLVSILASCHGAPPPAVEPEPPRDDDASVESEPELDPEPKPELEPEPEPEIDLTRNSAEALLASVDRITHIEVVQGSDVLLRFGDDVRDEIVESLREAELVESLSATTPPWPGRYVLLHVEGRDEPFIASMTGSGGLRVNANDPHGLTIADAEGRPDFVNIRDVGYSESMLDAAREVLGPPDSIEYSRRRPPARRAAKPHAKGKKGSKKRSKKGSSPEVRPSTSEDDETDPFGR